MKFNKRALIAGEMIMTIPRIFLIIAILFAFVILVKTLIVTEVDTRQVEADILVNRLLFSTNGTLYYDKSIDRLYPGILDLKIFTEISLNNPNILDTEVMNYGIDNPIIASKITLKQEGKEDIVAYYNKVQFDRWEPKILPGIRGGAGSVKAFLKYRYVLIKDGDSISPGVLEFLIIS